MAGALALGMSLLAAVAAEREPGLVETQEAAAKAAGGSAALDAARLQRARAAHWAPQVRAQALLREDERSRLGEFRLTPLREDDAAVSRTWSVTVTWDLSEVIFAREETRLALAQERLARARREAADKAAQLFIERRRAQAVWASARTVESCFALLRVTAALVALTGGLFREAAASEESACGAEAR